MAASFAWRALNTPLAIPADGTWLEVEGGASLRRVATQLGERGVLRHPWLLTAYARGTRVATKVRAGEYQIPAGTTPISLLSKLIAGQVFLHQLTIVEGWRFIDLLQALRADPAIVGSSLDGAHIMEALGAPGVHPEGQFFPDTYSFPKGTPEMDVLRQAHQALVTHLEAAWQSRSPDTALKSPYEALVLASIVEKETGKASDRPMVSSVFVNRLRLGMRLQTDPTVIYGMGDEYTGSLRRRDLQADTPWNTYTRSGLPPTPIAMPGLAALQAAMNPASSNMLYFVARGDGSSHFSRTLDEHNAAVNKYIRSQ